MPIFANVWDLLDALSQIFWTLSRHSNALYPLPPHSSYPLQPFDQWFSGVSRIGSPRGHNPRSLNNLEPMWENSDGLPGLETDPSHLEQLEPVGTQGQNRGKGLDIMRIGPAACRPRFTVAASSCHHSLRSTGRLTQATLFNLWNNAEMEIYESKPMSVLLPGIADGNIEWLNSHSFARFDLLSIPIAHEPVLICFSRLQCASFGRFRFLFNLLGFVQFPTCFVSSWICPQSVVFRSVLELLFLWLVFILSCFIEMFSMYFQFTLFRLVFNLISFVLH
jgi:hypothetical protein